MAIKKWFLILVLLFVATTNTTSAYTRIFYENCEDTDYTDTFLEDHYGTNEATYWEELKTEIDQSSISHFGNYSMHYDPFTTENPHANVGLGDVTYGNLSNFHLGSYNGRYWYFRWYQRWEDGIDWSGSVENKLLYINYNDSGDFVLTIKRNGIRNFHITVKDHDTYSLVDNPYFEVTDTDLDDEEWHLLELYIDVGTTGGHNGHYWFKVDGIKEYEKTGLDFNGTIHSNPIDHLTGWPSNISGTPTGTCNTWLDDLEIYILDGSDDIPPPLDQSSSYSKHYFSGQANFR